MKAIKTLINLRNVLRNINELKQNDLHFDTSITEVKNELKLSEQLAESKSLEIDKAIEEISKKQATFFQIQSFKGLAKYLYPRKLETKLLRFGNKFDGGYVISSFNLQNQRVLSLGVGDDISFENSLANIVKKIVLVDSTVEKPEILNSNIEFVPAFVVPEDQNREDGISLNKLLGDIINDGKELQTIILKIDIEGNEWAVLSGININYFKYISQIIVEFHGFNDYMYFENKILKFKKVLQSLYENFEIINIHGNNFASALYIEEYAIPDVLEVSYLNRDLLETLGAEPTLTNISINYANNPKKSDFTKLYWSL